MKKKLIHTLLILPCIAAWPLFAQTNTNGPSGGHNSPPPPLPPGGGAPHGPMAQLSESERAQVKAAHDKAIQGDPTLEQKMKEAHQAMDAARLAMHDAMIKADPTLEPILAKMNPSRDGKKGPGPEPQGSPPTPPAANPSAQPGPKGGGPGRHDGPGMATLSETERQQVKSLHEQVKGEPSVVAAREAVKNAATPEARQAAQEVLRQAMHDAMIKADPAIGPVLDKISPPKQPQ